jgi:Holliday junction DNA helicase RuvB
MAGNGPFEQDDSPRFFDPGAQTGEVSFEATLRPQSFDEFVGQRQTVENLKIYVTAARQRSEPLDHILLSGLPGLGKTTLATIISREIGANFKASSGPVLEKAGDLAGILTNLEEGDVLFIDEIHRLPRIVEEYLYSAMEDFTINIVLDAGPSARSLKIDLPRYTLIGATTREGLLTAPFRARFGVLEKLQYYPPEDLSQIIRRSARIMDVPIEDAAARLLAQRSRGTPRIANRFLRRIRDVAQVKGDGSIDAKIAEMGLGMLGIDHAGLEALDRKILEAIMIHGGGPVGLKTIAVAVGEEEGTIEEVYEPYLIQQGFLKKTMRGRMASDRAYKHLKRDRADSGKSLFE